MKMYQTKRKIKNKNQDFARLVCCDDHLKRYLGFATILTWIYKRWRFMITSHQLLPALVTFNHV